MNIIVQGEGEKNFTPDQIVLDFDFKTSNKEYNQALELGVKNVELYLDLLISMGFKKEDFKTHSFRVSEDKHYDEQVRKYIKDGYMFSQSVQLKFEYDMVKLSTLMEKTAGLENPPTYRINFNVKDDKQATEELLALAYENALFQANAIAKASGKTVTSCLRVSFEPFDSSSCYSRTRYEGAAMMSKCCSNSTMDTIQNVFVPEDVILSTSIYCEFIAE